MLRRRAVDVTVVAHLGEPFTVTLTCCDAPSLTATATGFTVEAAKTRAVEASDLVEHVGRMGSSPFEAASFDVSLDAGCGMGFSAVHKVRAAACKALEEAILAPYEERAKTLELPVIVTSDSRPAPAHYRDEPQICATVTTLEAAEAARAEGATRIYMTTDVLDAAGLSPTDAFEQGTVPVLDEVCRAVDHVRVDPWVVAGATVAIGNISELALAPRLAPRPRFALACRFITRPAWKRLPSAEPVRFGSRPRSRSTRLSRSAPPRPRRWASPSLAARAS